MIILWRVTNRCNLSCAFCAYDKRLDIARLTADPAQVARMITLLGAWRAQTGQDVLLSWLGGEPLLWADRAQMDTLARQNGVGLSLTTNGTQLGSGAVRAQLIEHYKEITISIDGLASFHDPMRQWPGAFDKLAQSIPALSAERTQAGAALTLRANIVLMHGNIGMFEELCLLLAQWGVDEISFNQLGGRDRPEFYPHNRLQPSDVTYLARILPLLRARLAQYGTRLAGGSAYLARLADTVAGRPLPITRCHVAERFVFIDETGQIAPCSFTPDHFGQSVDQLRTPADFSALPHVLHTQQKQNPSHDCADCPSTQQFSKFEILSA